VCRRLSTNDLTGPLPTELGTMDALSYLYVRRPHPPRLGACTVTGLCEPSRQIGAMDAGRVQTRSVVRWDSSPCSGGHL
jgi:hypothetical protein